LNKLTKVIFCSDLHGSELTFRKFVSAAKMHKVDAAIMGGDVTGKMLVPLVRQDGGGWKAEYLGEMTEVKSEGEKAGLVEQLNAQGFYPVEVDAPTLEVMNKDQSVVSRMFSEQMALRLRRWVEFLDAHLAPLGIKTFVMPGNDDELEMDEALSSGTRTLDGDGKILRVDEHHELLTIGNANITPWKCPRDLTEDQLTSKIDGLAGTLEHPQSAIFNIHVPPFDSTLDVCPKLDTSTFPPRPVRGETIAAGSTAVREMIEKYHPALSLHGHIHESRGIARIGRTTCINPGSEYSEGILKAVVVNLDDQSVKSRQFISG
jgi:uncharacterized protein